jgi:hydrogenase maturation protein HypF
VPEKNLNVLFRMMEQGINSPLTSSCGRLFDAVAALVGIRRQVNYEAQAAIELEMAIGNSCDESAYPFDLVPEGQGWVMDTRSLFEALLRDIAGGVPVGDVSRRFHNGLVEVLAEVGSRLREQSGLERACLSGGTFQNVYLFERLCARLRKDGFQVFVHGEVPAGDGGLSLGQALVAARGFNQSRVSG